MREKNCNNFWRSILILSWIMIAKPGFTQSNPNKDFYPQSNVLPKTPESEGLFKFSEFPVDPSSGTATTSIPIYTIQSGRLKLPITISYSATGVRVQDISSMIGLGWNLNFGYSISVDEEEAKPYSYSNRVYKSAVAAENATTNGTWMEEMKGSTNGYYQTMLNLYRFKCGEYSGTFFYDKDNNLKIIGTNDDVKIESIRNPPLNFLEGFNITTNDGIQYVFDKRETVKRESQAIPVGSIQTTSYHISRIIDLATGEYIAFDYRQKPAYFNFSNETYTLAFVYNPTTSPPLNAQWYPSEPYYSQTVFSVNSLQINSIAFNGGYVNFDSDTLRSDIDKTKITGISVYSTVYPSVLMKRAKFEQSYFVSPGLPGGIDQKFKYRLRLDAVTFYDPRNYSPQFKFSFEYNNIEMPPYRTYQQNGLQTNYAGMDYWGFYNGNSSGKGMIPLDIKNEFLALYPPMGTLPDVGSDRKANPSFTQAGVLKKIIYPTGGYASFDYENHQTNESYYLGQTLGGVRIKNIKYFDGSNSTKPALEKTYKYLVSKVLTPAWRGMYCYTKGKANAYLMNVTPPIMALYHYEAGYISSNPLYAIAYHNGSPVFYEKVEEIFGSDTVNTGKNVYMFNFSAPWYSKSLMKEMANWKLMPDDWARGQLLDKETYKNNSNTNVPNYVLSEKEINQYKGFSKHPNMLSLGLLVGKNGSWDIVGQEADSWYYTESHNNRIPINAFTYDDIFVLTGYLRLSKKINYQYEGGGTLVDSTSFFYESPNHHQLSRTEKTDSKGNIHTTLFRYVQDKNQITDVDGIENSSAFNALLDIYKLNDIIEEVKLINNIKKERKRLRFRSTYNAVTEYQMPIISKIEQYTYMGLDTIRGKLLMNSYNNKGMLLEKQMENDVLISYIWDDNSIYPISETVNSSKKNVFFTSFEYGGKGNWTYSGEGSYDAAAPTGKRSFQLTAPNKIVSSTIDVGTYLVSYWSKNGSYSVTGSTSVKVGSVLNGWTYYEHTVSNASIVEIAGNGYIDELRLRPVSALMTTFTYVPLTGMETQCDPSNKIICYEYDNMGRLNRILDQNKNILKEFHYVYTPQF